MDATLLSQEFDVTRLPEGLWGTASDLPAYPHLLAMTYAGDATLVGERDMPGGVRLIVVKVPAVRCNPDECDPFAGIPDRIGLGDEYVNKPMQYYQQNWQTAWWREAVQNAVDAGASEIRLEAKEQADGTWLVSCEDDGVGMSRETLINVFLKLGPTTGGVGTGHYGGFGIARELLALPWLWWRVRTRELDISGRGLNLDESARRYTPGRTRGTKIEVRMAADRHTSDVEARTWVSRCFLPNVRIIVNGHRVLANMEPGALKRTINHWAWRQASAEGKIYLIEGRPRDPTLFVRLRGMLMFSRPIEGKSHGHVVVEIGGNPRTLDMKQMLEATRNDFASDAVSYPVSVYLNELTVDPREAARRERTAAESKPLVYRGAMGKLEVSGLAEAKKDYEDRAAANLTTELGPIEPHGPKNRVKFDEDTINRVVELLKGGQVKIRAPVGMGSASPLAAGPGSSLSSVLAGWSGGGGASAGGGGESVILPSELVEAAMSRMPPDTLIAVLSSLMFKGPTHVDTAVRHLCALPDWMLQPADPDDHWRIPKAFRVDQGMPPRIYRLAKVWTEIVRLVFIVLNISGKFGVGFTFESGVKACYHKGDDGDADEGDWILVNPFIDTKTRKKLRSVANEQDLFSLFISAIHEATHVQTGETGHDQDFLAAVESNIVEGQKQFRAVRRVARTLSPRALASEVEAAKKKTELRASRLP